MSSLTEKLKRRLNKYQLDKVLSLAATFPPQPIDKNAAVAIVSQLYSDAVSMGIAAIYSFRQQLEHASCLEILDDGSLSETDYSVLHTVFPGVRIKKISDVPLNGCPKGGCWERLIHIQTLTSQFYVAQVDTDILTTNTIAEVNSCIENNRAFLSSSPDWQNAVPVKEIVDYASDSKSQNIQFVSERILDRIDSITVTHYVRGCAAFTGFPRHSNLLPTLAQFSEQMERKLGERWHEWGTEQLSSNVLLSLFADVCVLPWPKYQNFGFPEYPPLITDPTKCAEVSVVHFIGSNRFKHGVYRSLASQLNAKNLT